jgi:hypothetical protein
VLTRRHVATIVADATARGVSLEQARGEFVARNQLGLIHQQVPCLLGHKVVGYAYRPSPILVQGDGRSVEARPLPVDDGQLGQVDSAANLTPAQQAKCLEIQAQDGSLSLTELASYARRGLLGEATYSERVAVDGFLRRRGVTDVSKNFWRTLLHLRGAFSPANPDRPVRHEHGVVR